MVFLDCMTDSVMDFLDCMKDSVMDFLDSVTYFLDSITDCGRLPGTCDGLLGSMMDPSHVPDN